MTIAMGFVVTMALPVSGLAESGSEDAAVAHTRADATDSPTPAGQALSASASASVAPIDEDSFSATTEEELEQQRREAAAAAAAEARREAARQAQQNTTWVSSAVQAGGDNYPWWDGPIGVLSPLRYEYRECVDYVAWRLNQAAGTTSGNWAFQYGVNLPAGSAWKWANLWSYGSGHKAVAGAVAWFSYNHVSYVQQVNDNGTVVLEEYNYGAADHAFNRRVVSANAVDLYLYPPGVG